MWEELQRAQEESQELPTLAAAVTALAENRAPLWCEYKQPKAGTALGIL